MRLMGQGRARLLGAALGTCLVTAVGVTNAFAQDGTPVPSDQATPVTQTDEATPRASAAEKTALAEQLQDVTDTIATVQADRDAVGGNGDWTAVDDLLAKATQMRDTARATVDGDDVSAARQQLAAAEGAAMAAESLIRAQLSDYGLPSQQAGASRALVAAYNRIAEVSDRVSAGSDDNAKGFATAAQHLYKTAYDLYNTGTYAQAARTAEVATQVAGLADVLSGAAVLSTDGGGMIAGEPADGQDVVIIERRGGRPGFGPNERGRGKRDEGMPGFPGDDEVGTPRLVVIGPGGKGDGFAGPGAGDGGFSTDSPLEVPAPDFD
jgi:hypothetical protein